MLDPALPRLERLLDPQAMAPVLARSLHQPEAVEDVRGVYLRYKPHTNLRVHYEVRIGGRRHGAVVMIAAGADLARRARKAANRALARAVQGRTPAAAPLSHDAELDALVQWLPLDLALPGLAEPPAAMRHRLAHAGLAVGAAEPQLLAYKPHRRAVLRFDGLVVKAYATEPRYRAAEARLRAAAGLGVPTAPFAAALPALRVTVQPFLDGVVPASAAAGAGAAGTALRALHAAPAAGLGAFPPARQHTAVAEMGEMVKAIAPALARRVDALLRRLAETMPKAGHAVPAHGDFHEGQLLLRGDGVALIDLDELRVAPPALDLASYAAHQLWGEPGDLAHAEAVLDALASAYGERPSGLDWYFAALILRRASHPFRRLRDHWPDRVEAMLSAAEAVAAR